MYFIPMGLLLTDEAAVVEGANLPSDRLAGLDAAGRLSNITAATLTRLCAVACDCAESTDS